MLISILLSSLVLAAEPTHSCMLSFTSDGETCFETRYAELDGFATNLNLDCDNGLSVDFAMISMGDDKPTSSSSVTLRRGRERLLSFFMEYIKGSGGLFMGSSTNDFGVITVKCEANE